RALAAQAPAAQAAERALYQTQVARALGLQQRFDEAQAVLDTVEAAAAALPPGATATHVRARLAIERGRAWNSAGDFGRARPLFEQAVALADSAGLEGLAVDAAHMVAIAARIEMHDATGGHEARWAVARCLRSLGRIDEALAAQRALLAEDENTRQHDGYVYEEIGECLAAQHKEAEAQPWFAKAYADLS